MLSVLLPYSVSKYSYIGLANIWIVITVCRKAEMFARVLIHSGPWTLLRRYDEVDEPYAQYPTKVTTHNGKSPTVKFRYRALSMFFTEGDFNVPCISGSIPVLYTKTRFAAAAIQLNILCAFEP